MSSNSKCGPHTELVSNNAVRVSRCGCGTFHVTLVGAGVTVRMSAETFRGAAAGLSAAADRLDESSSFGTTSIN